MGKINRIPKGLLDLLSSKSDGRNPQELADSVAPTIDLSPFYLNEKIGHAFGTFVAGNVGDSGTIEIPSGEIWLLFAVDIEWTSAVANKTLDLTFNVEEIPSAASILSSVCIFSTGTFAIVTADDVATFCKVFDRPLPFPPGVVFRTTTNVQIGGNTNVATNVLFYRLQI